MPRLPHFRARHPGIVRMSTTTSPVSERIADYGVLVRAGIATHHLTLYRHHAVDALGDERQAVAYDAHVVGREA